MSSAKKRWKAKRVAAQKPEPAAARKVATQKTAVKRGAGKAPVKTANGVRVAKQATAPKTETVPEVPVH